MLPVRQKLLCLVIVAALVLSAAPTMAEGSTLTDSIDEIMRLLRTHYLRPIDGATEAHMRDETLKALVRGLGDPHTTYMTRDEYLQFVQGLGSDQRFGGVGIVIDRMGDYITVISPLRGTPAEAADIKPRDVIMAVDGQSLVGRPMEKAVYLIRGEPGTEVTLTIRREGVPGYFDVTLVRAEIVVPTVETQMLEGNVGLIELYRFSDDAGSLVEEALDDLKRRGATSLILDVRGNGGGYLNAAIAVADLFLPVGAGIVDIHSRDNVFSTYLARSQPETDMPLVVLTDAGSASSSEIVAGALKAAQRATLIGANTFGKGTVQNLIWLQHGGVLKVTSSEFRLPTGGAIEGRGLTPHHIVDNHDAQLRRAVLYLTGASTSSIRLLRDRDEALEGTRSIPLPGPGLVEHEGLQLVPVRPVADFFGIRVGWDGETRTVSLTHAGSTVQLRPGYPEVWLDGALLGRQYPSLLLEGRTYVSTGFVQDLLGLIVEQDNVGRWIEVMR